LAADGRLPVKSQSTAKTVRDRPISHYWATQWTHLQLLRPPLPQTVGSQPPVKACIANCGKTVPDSTVGLYWQPMGTYHYPTQRRPPMGRPTRSRKLGE